MNSKILVILIAGLSLLGLIAWALISTKNLCMKDGKPTFNILECQFDELDKITIATYCAFIRCTEGCGGSKVNSIRSGDFNCKEWCQESSLANPGEDKICDFGNPVIVELDKPLELTKKDLEKLGIRCLTESRYNYWYDQIFRVEISTDYASRGNIFPVFVDENSINSKGDLETNSKCFESLTINKGEVYVYYGYKPFTGAVSGCNPYGVGYISHSPIKTIDNNKVVIEIGNYYLINSNVGISIPGDYIDFYNNIIDRCPDGNYGIKLAVNCNGLKSEIDFCQGETKNVCNGLKLTPDPSIGFPPATMSSEILYCHPWVFEIS